MTIAVIRPGKHPVIRPGENTGEAMRQAVRARNAAAAAAVSEAVALAAAGPNYADAAAGLLATSEGDTFAVEDDGIVTVYRHDSGPTATELRVLPTTAALASTDGGKGAGMVGWKRTGDPTSTDLQPQFANQVFDRQPISIREYATGAIELENAFDLLNKATGADLDYSGNASLLNRQIVIDVPLVFPAEDRSVFIRRGQELVYAPNTQLMDLTALAGNTVPVFRLARKSDGSLDPGGLPVVLRGFRTLGGPTASSVFDCANVTNPMFYDNFVTAVGGVGINLEDAADADITNHYVDGGNIGILLGGQNHVITNLNCYNASVDVLMNGKCYSCQIIGHRTSYCRTASILADVGGSIKNLQVVGHSGDLNEQFSSFKGFVVWRANDSDAHFIGAAYRNVKGPAVHNDTGGSGSRLIFDSLDVDGLKTNPVYTQSTDAAAFSDVGMEAEFGRVVVRNCPGTPFVRNGLVPGSLRIGGGRFADNTGGAADIVSTDGNAASFIDLHGVRSDRALVTESGLVKVRTFDCLDSGNTTGPVTVPSAAALPVPHVGNFLYVTGTTNITSIAASYAGREITIIFGGVLNVTDGGNLFLAGNLVTATNTMVKLVCDGTNWHEICRSVN